MIQIHDWSRGVSRGSEAIVSFALRPAGTSTGPSRPVVELQIDAIGDGLPGITVRGSDLRAVRALALPMPRAGTFSLRLSAVDAAGCQDETAMRREVVVR